MTLRATPAASSPDTTGEPGRPSLFQPMVLRDLVIPHRVWVSPMCQYSAVDGVVQHWHAAHYGQWALHQAGLIVTEATAVSPEGRISPLDAGIWNSQQAEAWKPLTEFSHARGVPMVVQLAHAGRKGSVRAPFHAGEPPLGEREGAWITSAPSAEAYGSHPAPHAMSRDEILTLIDRFEEATTRAVEAGFAGVQLHTAHGYLLHQFLTPLSNHRDDSYGGDFEGRTRLILEITERIRSVMPTSMPLLVRLSGSDWLPGGWDLDQVVRLAQALESLGVDMVDVSSGGLDPAQAIAVAPGYQRPFAQAVRNAVRIPVGTVGLITTSQDAEEALREGSADAVLVGRQFLREPSFARRAAWELGVDLPWPGQYERAKR